MPNIAPFENHFEEYEAWFDQNRSVYHSELEAVRWHLPSAGRGLEIGVGSGLFAVPLGVLDGVEPSPTMRAMAIKRGINTVDGVAEMLPFADSVFDFALMVTAICFFDDVPQAIAEANRVLKPEGSLIVGFIVKTSPIGLLYEKYKQDNVFYRDATLYSVREVTRMISKAGFEDLRYTQTIFKKIDLIKEQEKVKDGFGDGSFVVVSGRKILASDSNPKSDNT